VHRYIEAARREFEESKRKGRSSASLGNNPKACSISGSDTYKLPNNYLFRVLWPSGQRYSNLKVVGPNPRSGEISQVSPEELSL